jgi:predicted GNAT family acetyltransferase
VGGHGHGSTLVRAALDDVRARGLSVIPLCPFVKAYIEKHPEYADLLKTA